MAPTPTTAHSCANCEVFTLDWESEDCMEKESGSFSFRAHLTAADVEIHAKDGCALAQYILDKFNTDCDAESQARRDSSARLRVDVFTGTISLLQVRNPDRTGTDALMALLASEDDAAAEDIAIRPVNCDPTSIKTIQTVRSWLALCLKQQRSHAPNFPSAPFMPTRVLEIMEPGTAGQVRITELPLLNPYATLSYCWGGPQKLSLTKNRLQTGALTFRKHEMPPTIRDAIRVAEELDLRFLWVDALCIVQDDPQDKAIEINAMADIYAHGTITIMASRSNSVDEGFLHNRFPFGVAASDQGVRLTYRTRSGKQGSVVAVPDFGGPEEPLDQRGWAFQEYLLSPRILSFGQLHTAWFCDRQADADCSKNKAPRSDGLSDVQRSAASELRECMLRLRRTPTSNSRPSPEDFFNLWYNMLHRYMGRELTYCADRLPALAAVAQRMQWVLGDEYLAGLWSGSIVRGLMWYRDDEPVKRLAEYSAPSWTWASIAASARIYFRNFTALAPHFSIIDCRTFPTYSAAPYGSVQYGYLRVTGLLVPAFFDRSTPVLCSRSLSMANFPGFVNPHVDAIDKEWETNDASIPLYLLCVALDNGSMLGLILRELDTGEYNRWGFFTMRLADRYDAQRYSSYAEDKPRPEMWSSSLEEWVEMMGDVKDIVIV
ncbi:heterokaryon incompatibility protein-domain-containing protein [Cercophora newfieldiana]|uniref:Heterokaryon incompatibility protein-domain-containing protein n=1 Tax=Cercophora newfieldiana TaxID=92897 RepID=A0AA39YGL9_9PEZI|nr:heterokaryon incompatibility protein-domain-containing protein [Cercophora newfieldiana]